MHRTTSPHHWCVLSSLLALPTWPMPRPRRPLTRLSSRHCPSLRRTGTMAAATLPTAPSRSPIVYHKSISWTFNTALWVGSDLFGLQFHLPFFDRFYLPFFIVFCWLYVLLQFGILLSTKQHTIRCLFKQNIFCRIESCLKCTPKYWLSYHVIWSMKIIPIYWYTRKWDIL